ncbi:MAG: HAMP domain-containing sensor histidine kinase [Phycisphaerae bacterium]
MPQRDPLPGSELTLTDRELFERLGWFTQVRWGAGLLSLAFMAIGWYAFHVRFAWQPALAVVAGLFAYNLVFVWWARRLYRHRQRQKRRIRRLAHAQIACDLVAVAALVHTIGGVENHFILLFVFPVIVASEFFAPRIAYAYATLAAVLIHAIGWGEFFFYDRFHYGLTVCETGAGERCVPLVAAGAGQHYVFVLQVCFVMTFAVYVTVFVASSIAGRLRQREEELEEAYRGLKSLEQVKSQFMRKTSHELRAPLATMQSLLNAAARQMPDDASGRDLVDRALARSQNTLDLVDDLLRYSRLQAVLDVDRFEAVELAGIVRSAADLFRAQAEEKGIRLEAEVAATPVRGIRDRLIDLVNNLISNAIRYTGEGGTVTVRAGCDGGEAVLIVSDTGIGIPPDELPRIFDEFYRGEAARQRVTHGTGLGMTIVRRVVDLHKGRIDVDSRPGRGTTFRVALSICRDRS